jgi:hypothetical protein
MHVTTAPTPAPPNDDGAAAAAADSSFRTTWIPIVSITLRHIVARSVLQKRKQRLDIISGNGFACIGMTYILNLEIPKQPQCIDKFEIHLVTPNKEKHVIHQLPFQGTRCNQTCIDAGWDEIGSLAGRDIQPVVS